ncbi:hypothetical protein [Paenibacillus alkalitolerans]|nr:hypothetical protein [Paenibacillus alkalitolerans]
MLAAYFSKRIYKNTIEQPVIDAVADASERFFRPSVLWRLFR